MRIAKIKPNDVINGNGIVVSVWTQGCPHHCKGCFNKGTWSFTGGREYTKEDKENILKMLDANNVKRNLSVLGGEPFAEENIDDVLELCDFIRKEKPDREIFVWTGFTVEYLAEKYGWDRFKSIDVIVDGKFEEDKKDLMLMHRGSSNQRIIRVKDFTF